MKSRTTPNRIKKRDGSTVPFAGQRETKSATVLVDDLKLPLNTIEVLKKRYLLKNEKQQVIETPCQLFMRAAKHIASAEENFKAPAQRENYEEIFYQMMRNLEFIPNSPTLMNAGTELGQLSACFVLPVDDSIDGIFETLRNMAKIHQTGGGTGFDFSSLRPKSDIVKTTKGFASGPVSFMSVYDQATAVIVQGGRRRGANMGILRCDHPDIVDFIQAKTEHNKLNNFNISVAVTNRFMNAVIKNQTFPLINPRTGKAVKRIKAAHVFDMIAHAAWENGDPGMIFLDRINGDNPTPELGKIRATNPCGELPLLPYESCNLGSINLSRMVEDEKVDWKKLAKTIRLAVRFLDDVIEVNKYPLEEIKKITMANRKIGLGVMGFADMLIKLGMSYDSDSAVDFAGKLMKFIRAESLAASSRLAEERGVFPNYPNSIYAAKKHKMRNATLNTIAPTGTISIIASCSSGIEPLFALIFARNVLSGTKLVEINAQFEEAADKLGFKSEDLFAKIARKNSIKDFRSIPSGIRDLFVTAFDVPYLRHLEIQAAFQKYTDNAVAKTINLEEDSNAEQIKEIYMQAYKMKCKGITVYRYNSRAEQVLCLPDETEKANAEGIVSADAEFAGGCAGAQCEG